MKRTYTLCDHCEKTIKDGESYIELTMPECHNEGIWFGDIRERLPLSDQVFCSWECFIQYITKWHAKHKAAMNDDE